VVRHIPAAVWFPILLVTLTLAAYAPALRAGFIWDDDSYLTANPTLTKPDALRRIWLSPAESPQYYPMVFTVLLAEKKSWGLDPRGYHLVNVLLHAGSAILLWRLLRRLKAPGAMAAAVIFAVHPMAVESVAWVTELKNTLAGVLCLGAVLAYLPFGLAEGRRGRREWGWYALSLGLFVLAMWSKTVSCGVAPVLVLLLWWKRERVGMRDLWPLAPFFLIGAALGLLTAHLEVNNVGATGADFAFSPWDRVLIAGRAVWFYAGKAVWPFDLAFFYPRWGIDVRVWWQWLFPLAAAAGLAALWWQRQRVGKGAVAGVAAFVVLLFPALGFVNVYPMLFSFVADHFGYLALMAAIPVVVATLASVGRAGQHPAAAAIATALVVGVLVWSSQADARTYESDERLWLTLVAKNQHWMGYRHLGDIALRRAVEAERAGDKAEMRRQAEMVFSLGEKVLAQKSDRADVYSTFVQAALLTGDMERAEAAARRAIAEAPGQYLGYVAMARVLRQKGQVGAAAAELRKAAALSPKAARAMVQLELGKTMLSAGQEAEAEQAFAAAAAFGETAEAYEWLGTVRAMRGEMGAAREAYRRALAIDGADGAALDGLARATAMDSGAAPAELQEALLAATAASGGAGRSARSLDTLGMVRWRMGDRAGAAAAAREAMAMAGEQERGIIERHLQMYETGLR
jgi:Tfp pilus assembly protein PilF